MTIIPRGMFKGLHRITILIDSMLAPSSMVIVPLIRMEYVVSVDFMLLSITFCGHGGCHPDSERHTCICSSVDYERSH